MKKFWITNLLFFQASWFCAAFYTGIAVWFIGSSLIVHFLLSPTPLEDLKAMFLSIAGLLADSLHIAAGTFYAVATFFPVWLIFLWFIFVITFNHCLRWLMDCSYALIALFGAVGGALSYWAGIEAGALSSDLSSIALLLRLTLGWAVLFPLLVLGHRLIRASEA